MTIPGLRRLQTRIEQLAEHPSAYSALFSLAFIEAILFPIPADVLLIALAVNKPRKALYAALICTLGSVLGAGLGYALGHWSWYTSNQELSQLAHFFFNHVPGFTPERFHAVQALYQKYDFWAIFVAGFTPLPYKVFTVTAGVFKLHLPTFFLASILSRGARFFLIGGLFYLFGTSIKAFIDKYLEPLAIAFVMLLIGGFVLIRWL